MFANAALSASVICLAVLLFAMSQLRFLTPWRDLIFREYWSGIAWYLGMLFLNVFGLAIYVQRKLLLKDAGQKLAHFDKQLRDGDHELSAEIAAQFSEE
jgi:hypothetical protein